MMKIIPETRHAHKLSTFLLPFVFTHKFTCICCVLLVLSLRLFPCLIYCKNTLFFSWMPIFVFLVNFLGRGLFMFVFLVNFLGHGFFIFVVSKSAQNMEILYFVGTPRIIILSQYTVFHLFVALNPYKGPGWLNELGSLIT